MAAKTASLAFGLTLLASLAHAGPVDVDADIIWDDSDAAGKCPQVCSAKSLYWTGRWHKVGWASQYMCVCDANAPPPQQSASTPPPVHNQSLPPVRVRVPGGTVMRFEFTDFKDASDLRNVSSPSFEHCASACIAAGDCGAFTFASDQRRCYMKVGPGNQQSAPSAISGVVISRGQ